MLLMSYNKKDGENILHIKSWIVLILIIGFLNASAYAESNEPALASNPFEKLLLPPSNAKQMRLIQIKRIKTKDEHKLYMTCISVLQDLGFSINKSNQSLGYARGVKDRAAEAPAQEIAINILNVLAILTGNQPASYEKEQTINAMFVITPVYTVNNNEFDVRITFHRFLRQPFRTRAEVLENPKLYKSFFSLLNKARFLKEHKL